MQGNVQVAHVKMYNEAIEAFTEANKVLMDRIARDTALFNDYRKRDATVRQVILGTVKNDYVRHRAMTADNADRSRDSQLFSSHSRAKALAQEKEKASHLFWRTHWKAEALLVSYQRAKAPETISRALIKVTQTTIPPKKNKV